MLWQTHQKGMNQTERIGHAWLAGGFGTTDEYVEKLLMGFRRGHQK